MGPIIENICSHVSCCSTEVSLSTPPSAWAAPTCSSCPPSRSLITLSLILRAWARDCMDSGDICSHSIATCSQPDQTCGVFFNRLVLYWTGRGRCLVRVWNLSDELLWKRLTFDSGYANVLVDHNSMGFNVGQQVVTKPTRHSSVLCKTSPAYVGLYRHKTWRRRQNISLGDAPKIRGDTETISIFRSRKAFSRPLRQTVAVTTAFEILHTQSCLLSACVSISRTHKDNNAAILTWFGIIKVHHVAFANFLVWLHALLQC